MPMHPFLFRRAYGQDYGVSAVQHMFGNYVKIQIKYNVVGEVEYGEY
jgi:hypothetical protein